MHIHIWCLELVISFIFCEHGLYFVCLFQHVLTLFIDRMLYFFSHGRNQQTVLLLFADPYICDTW